MSKFNLISGIVLLISCLFLIVLIFAQIKLVNSRYFTIDEMNGIYTALIFSSILTLICGTLAYI